MRAHSKFLGAAVALAAVTLTNLPSASAVTGVPFTNALPDKVYGAGSDTTFGIMEDLAQAYLETDGCLVQSISSGNFPYTGTEPQQSCQTYVNDPINAADNIYENYDHDIVFNYFPQGSNAGRGQLCNQKTSADGGPDRNPLIPYVDFARSSSAPGTGFQCTVATGGETGTVLRFVAFARDALTWTHWNGGGGAAVTNLTQAQLNDIFVDCAITDWGQVGGTAGVPIIVYTSIPGSGTRSTWDSFVGGSSSGCAIPAQFKDGDYTNGERVIREHQMEPVEIALNDPAAANEGNSIYYMSTGIHASSPGHAGSSLLGNVNGIAPTEANIVSGTFPFSRDLYNVLRQSGPAPTASGATRRFLGMINPTATNGQSIGWICKAEANHSEPVGTAGPGIETATAGSDWYEIKQAAFVANGIYQLPADPTFGDQCNFTDVTVP